MPQALTLRSVIPPGDLLIRSLTANQGLSLLEEFELELLSPKPDLAPEDLLGLPIGVDLLLRDGSRRQFNGLVMRLGIGAAVGELNGYRASVRPWLWFLTRTSDCRIFQDLDVKQIVQQVFADHAAIADFEFRLDRDYRRRNYCVQYRESDYNFIARLLEEEGIFWYFQHADGKHRLILVDDIGALAPVPGYERLPHYENTAQVPPDVDYIAQWTFSREVQSGRTATRSYDFTRPGVDLGVDASRPRDHALADYESYDYQGEYTAKGDGQHLADMRIDESQARHERLGGSTNALGLAVGHLFSLLRHPRDDQNAQYLCAGTRIAARSSGYGAGADGGDFHCSFTAAPVSQAWRAPRSTPKPFVQGPQTAVVVGPAGDEIHTDAYGRVKVQFHWDRYGLRNEKSSCWVRVSSPWAGKNFGFVQIPRIGQEVVVDFLEGDPDQPLITGRVYNAEQMPPWELPANATQSGVLTRSSKAGHYGTANALRFEDKIGAEQLWLHAEKDQLTEVEHDEDKWVGNDRRKTIDGHETSVIHKNRTETVDQNETITVHQNRTETVDLDERITIHKNRSERVDLNENVSIGVNRTEDVGANETVSIGANRSVTVGGNKSETVARAKAETIGMAKALTIGAAYQTSVGGLMNTTVGGFQSEQVGLYKIVEVLGGDYSVNVGSGSKTIKASKRIVLEAGEEIVLQVGASTLVMKTDGTITLNGKEIFATGDTHIKLASKIIDLN